MSSELSIPLHDFLALDWDRPEMGARQAQVRMPIQPNALGFTGFLHGGAIATLVDMTCALATARATAFDPTRESLVTSDMHVRYLAAARGDWVTATADVVRVGSQLVVIECKVCDSEDKLVATADMSVMRVPLRSADGFGGTP